MRCSLRGCGPGGSDETVLFLYNRYLLNPAPSIVQDVDAFCAAYERGLGAAKADNSAETIQAFEEARAYYTGDYFADPYEEWASSSRVTLQDRWLHVLERLGALYSEARTWASAIACSSLLIATAKVSLVCSWVATQQLGVWQRSSRPTSPAGDISVVTCTWPLLPKQPCSTSG